MSSIRLPFLIFLFVLLAWASDIKGVIEQIDVTNKTVTVNGKIIKVMPYTEIEEESCGIGWGSTRAFSDLEINDIVEVDIFYDNGRMIAKEIEIACKKNRAY